MKLIPDEFVLSANHDVTVDTLQFVDTPFVRMVLSDNEGIQLELGKTFHLNKVVARLVKISRPVSKKTSIEDIMKKLEIDGLKPANFNHLVVFIHTYGGYIVTNQINVVAMGSRIPCNKNDSTPIVSPESDWLLLGTAPINSFRIEHALHLMVPI